MSRRIRILDFPEKFVPDKWKIEYDIKLLEIDGKCEALVRLNEFRIRDIRDLKKLMGTLKMQLKSKEVLDVGSRLSRYDSNSAILEFKSPRGASRLFGFLSDDDSIIICTNGFWKTTGKRAKQDAAFKRADLLRNEYYELACEVNNGN